MIAENDLIEAGKFQRTHALKGELNAILDIPFDYFEEDHPLIVKIEGMFIPFYTESIRSKGATTCLIKLNGIDTEEEASEFVNLDIYVSKEAIKEYIKEDGEEIMMQDELTGYEVIDDTSGPVGIVKRIDDSTSNILMIVESDNGEDIYVPLIDEFIVEIDNEKRTIRIDAPEELLRLNRKNYE